jgi:hypothetical protein
MNEPSYPFQLDQTEFVYTFQSVSAGKVVQKVVILTDIQSQRIFNLALMDEQPDGTLSDQVVTNNDDMRTVLATVFRIIDDFTSRFPGVFVYFRGTDTRRTRLYRMALNHELEHLEEEYLVLGQRGDTVIPFVRNEAFDGFLIRKKHENPN